MVRRNRSPSGSVSSISGDPAPGAEARIADPAWLLGREWQFGELTGENAGSVVAVEVAVGVQVEVPAWLLLEHLPVVVLVTRLGAGGVGIADAGGGTFVERALVQAGEEGVDVGDEFFLVLLCIAGDAEFLCVHGALLRGLLHVQPVHLLPSARQ